MAWSKLLKPAWIAGNFIRGFLHGSVDEVVSTFSDSEIIRFKDTAEVLNNCHPWENHLRGDAYDAINLALRQKDYQKARSAVDKHVTGTEDPHCITILKLALVEVCTKCTTLLLEALPEKIYVPKS